MDTITIAYSAVLGPNGWLVSKLAIRVRAKHLKVTNNGPLQAYNGKSEKTWL